MTLLPILNPPHPQRHTAKPASRFHTIAVHTYRVVLFLTIIAMIHFGHRWYTAQRRGDRAEPIPVADVLTFFSEAEQLGAYDPDHGGQTVTDRAGELLGFVVQTSPESDKVIGFSGPTNTLIAFNTDNKISGLKVIRSGDTKEHLQNVVQNEAFKTSLNGLSWQQAGVAQVDAVSGATLTSMAIMEGISLRLGGRNPSSRFPDPISINEVKPFFDTAVSLIQDDQKPSLLKVLNDQGEVIGHVARTSPHADQMIGYQGPTDTLIAINNEGTVIGAAIRHSFDNEPYVRYVKEDHYFFNIFKGFTLADVAALDMVDAGIDGVSGATKTSTTVAEALIATAGEIEQEQPLPEKRPQAWLQLTTRDFGTALVIAAALAIALTHLRGNKRLRIGLQVVLVVYLGFINADMLSQALLVGWSQNGVAWRGAPALVLLTLAALACPIFTGRQVYCTHLCPFGALQDWLRRVPLRVRVPQRIDRILRLLPVALLVFVVVVAMLHLPMSLVGLEPFDAFVFRVAGAATISIAVIGLVSSMLVPMAYCHYGCPTGEMLRYLRLSRASGRLAGRDLLATALTLAAVGMYLWSTR